MRLPSPSHRPVTGRLFTAAIKLENEKCVGGSVPICDGDRKRVMNRYGLDCNDGDYFMAALACTSARCDVGKLGRDPFWWWQPTVPRMYP